ncbi:MAG: DUF192 domain-containing protein [Bacilli bacterium]|jgi:uncharacterized membrane protein (UPF0127 family)|nr:DUF192 domain-containing protein [Bacilli bacterium]
MKFDFSLLNINIIECNNFKSRLLGFMFRIPKINHGLLFPNCNSIHTLFMFQKIDVVMTDKKSNILYMYENLKPFRLILPKKEIINVYELPIGSIKKIKSIH